MKEDLDTEKPNPKRRKLRKQQLLRASTAEIVMKFATEGPEQ